MRVILISIGTDGDIFPYVGLGAALLSRGHSITLAASEEYEPLAQAPDAVYLDSTSMSIDEVEEAILKIVRSRVTNGRDFS